MPGRLTLPGMDPNTLTPQQALSVLDCVPPAVQHLRTQDTLDTALAEWKRTTLRTAYRTQAKRWHPDRNHADQATECQARMALVNAAHTLMQGMALVLRRPQPQPRTIVINIGGFGMGTSTGTATGYTTSATSQTGRAYTYTAYTGPHKP